MKGEMCIVFKSMTTSYPYVLTKAFISALTGEVHPVAKLALDPSNQESFYSQNAFKSSTISAGTTVLECAEGEGMDGVLAICTETGSFTAKGELLSDVLSYERHQFKFDTEVKLVSLNDVKTPCLLQFFLTDFVSQ